MNAPYATKVLPTEILEVIIDQLHTDLRMLRICSLVCSNWLTRSRYHVFSTIRLSPRSARRFFELYRSKPCTFVNCVKYIDVDGGQSSGDNFPNDATDFPFSGILSLSSSPLTHIKSLSIRNVNWTSFPPSEQNHFRQHLASFTELHTLEFDNVTFHDLREVVQIISCFPLLSHIVIDVEFSKYIEHAISSAAALTLPSHLQILRLCADEAIPVLLNTTFNGSNISQLILDGVKLWHLPYIRGGVQNLREGLQHLQIDFSRAKDQVITVDDLAQLDFTPHTNLQSFRFGGIYPDHKTISCTLEQGSPCPISPNQPGQWKMAEVNLSLIVGPESIVRQSSSCALHRVILAMLHCRLDLDVSICHLPAGSDDTTGESVEIMIYGESKGPEGEGMRIDRRFD